MNTPPSPPFRFTRESRIRVDRDGRVWHEGERIDNARLAEALASWIDLDADTGRWVMRNSLDWCFVTVDDVPLVVRSVRFEPEGMTVALSDGSTERLRLDTLRLRDDGEVFAYVRGSTLLARFSRAASFALLDRVEEGPDGPCLRLGDARIALRIVPPGALPPPRPVDAEA
jgi:hypothetical protein